MRRQTRRPGRRGFALLDAMIGGIMLGIGLTVILAISSRSLALQRDGEKRLTAAWLADELLTMVLVEGPDVYPRQQDMNGSFRPPFQEYQFEIDIDDLGRGAPYRVSALVRWDEGEKNAILVETLIALRLGDPEQLREPYEPVDRDARYEELDEF